MLGLSENLKVQIEKNPMLDILDPARELEFDAGGNLAPIFAGAAELVSAH